MICQNGGNYDGIKCICPPKFYGSLCEFIDDIFTVENINVTVNITVKVTNENFTPELKNKTSEAYQNFSRRFGEQMGLLYRGVPGYQGVEIISLRNGSIIVDHIVLVNVPFSEYNDLEQTFKHTFDGKNCTNSSSEDMLCFNENSTTVNVLEPNIEGFCLENIPVDYQHYFYALNISNTLKCVTNCSTENEYYYRCRNGHCSVQRQGPSCFCVYSDLYWYTGDRCQVAINKSGVYGGVAVGLAVLLIVIVTLAVFLYKRRSKASSQWEENPEQKWYEEAWEPNNYEGFTIRNLGAVNWGGAESGGSTSSKEYFHPSLDKVDTNVQLKISRPQVTSL